MKNDEHIKLLISEKEIRHRIDELAREIVQDLQKEGLLIIGLLQGSFVFLSDLIRSLSKFQIPLQVDFMTVASYGSKTKASGKIQLVQDVRMDISNQPVLLIDDIYDTGRTLNFVQKHLEERNPTSLKICVLLDKDVEKVVPIKIDYIGFKVPDEFIVGYGLDYDNRYRELPTISTISFS